MMAGLLTAGCFLVYLTSLQCSPSWDTIPARLLPFSILREGNLDLNEFSWLQRFEGTPYFLRRVAGGRIVSKYPVAPSLIALPVALPAVWWLQRHQVSDDDVRFRLVTVVVERLTAALIAALSVSLLYVALCRLTTSPRAAAIALVYAFGSNTWATSSQALWQHGLAELSLAGLCVCLLGADTGGRAVGASLWAALGVLARPTMAIFALLAGGFMWRERRRHLPAFVVLPLLGVGALVLYNLRAVGSVLGGYAGVSFLPPSLTRLLGLLVSPNRGLLVYTPVAILALPAVVQWRRHRAPWGRYLAAGVLAYLLLYASFDGWWGGLTYGPRFLVDVLPAFAVCAVPTVERLRWNRLTRGVLVGLVAWSVAVQAIGVYCDFDTWNHTPMGVDRRPDRVWDGWDPQILRALRGGWHGSDLGPLLWQMLTDPRPAPLTPIVAADLVGDLDVDAPTPLHYRAGGFERLTARVTNRGHAVWPAFSDYGELDCRVIGVWKVGDETIGNRSETLPLPRSLGSGESVRIHGTVVAPTRPGKYDLDLILVQMTDFGSGVYGGLHRRVAVEVQ